MTITLELTPEQEARLRAKAERSGQDLTDYALARLLDSELSADIPAGEPAEKVTEPMTGAEILAYWEREGCLGVFADDPRDSVEIARELRRKAQDRGYRL